MKSILFLITLFVFSQTYAFSANFTVSPNTKIVFHDSFVDSNNLVITAEQTSAGDVLFQLCRVMGPLKNLSCKTIGHPLSVQDLTRLNQLLEQEKTNSTNLTKTLMYSTVGISIGVPVLLGVSCIFLKHCPASSIHILWGTLAVGAAMVIYDDARPKPFQFMSLDRLNLVLESVQKNLSSSTVVFSPLDDINDLNNNLIDIFMLSRGSH